MEPFTVLKGVAAPLMRQNVDTDVIIRIERLIEFGRKELGPYAFESWRYRPDGSENPDFLLNQEPYRNAKILLNGLNFGCGSSREGAVWALLCKGIRCVVAPSFGDIFFGNCFQNGVLPIILPLETVEGMADEARANPAGEFTVDLMKTLIHHPERPDDPVRSRAAAAKHAAGGIGRDRPYHAPRARHRRVPSQRPRPAPVDLP